jgi:hypothetical protein
MHQCHKDGCTSPAEFSVNLHLGCPSPGLATRVVSMRCSIEVCEKHKDDVADYVLSDKNKETIAATLIDQGIPEPDFLSARFEFVPIGAPALGTIDEPVARDDQAMPVPGVTGCDREGCSNPAQWRVVQRFRSIAQGGRGEPIIEALTNIHVCTAHKREVKPADFLDPESRQRTLEFLRGQGMLLPDVDHPIIYFMQLVGGEPEARQKRTIAQ